MPRYTGSPLLTRSSIEATIIVLAACIPTVHPFVRRAKARTETIVNKFGTRRSRGYQEFSGSDPLRPNQDSVELVDHRADFRLSKSHNALGI